MQLDDIDIFIINLQVCSCSDLIANRFLFCWMQPCGTDLIKNGNFAADYSDWTIIPAITLSNYYAGYNSINFCAQDLDADFFYQTLQTVIGSHYTMTFRIGQSHNTDLRDEKNYLPNKFYAKITDGPLVDFNDYPQFYGEVPEATSSHTVSFIAHDTITTVAIGGWDAPACFFCTDVT